MNIDEIGSYLDGKDFDYYLDAAMEKVPDGVDTREGSIIYDALAPACYQLAEFTLALKIVLLESFVQTASGTYLDLKAEEHGIKRIAATQAIVRGRFLAEDGSAVSLSEGNRFSSTGEDVVYYSVIQQEPGTDFYTLRAESFGVIGNRYVGTLLPIDHFNGLASAELVEVIIPARDEESDDSLRSRILATYQVNNFGGNIEDYINLAMAIDGVSAVQVYPTWNGGGTVRLVILDNSFGLPSNTLLANVQEIIDPGQTQQGYGLAPIGHQVTVAAPVAKNVNISLHIDPFAGFQIETLKPLIQAQLENYFLTLRKAWSNHNDLYQYNQAIYRSQIIAALLQLEGIANVANVRIDGADRDVSLQLDKSEQEVAFLGTVTYV